MQMEKKITTKEDGRFLVYYHFPDTATEEETQVFEGIEEEKEKRRKGEKETEEDSSFILHPSSLPETGGVPHV